MDTVEKCRRYVNTSFVKKEPAPAEAAAVRLICRERGVLIGVGGQEGNVLRVQPPLVISQDELGRALDVVEEGTGHRRTACDGLVGGHRRQYGRSRQLS